MKFRVFDKNLKEKMIYLDQHEELKLVFYSDGTWVVVDESGTIVTSNGGHGGKLMMGIDFKDKNGKEIYRGDIVRDKKDKWIIQYNDVEACYDVVLIGEIQCWKHLSDLLEENRGKIEVIGNIYENPELLR